MSRDSASSASLMAIRRRRACALVCGTFSCLSLTFVVLYMEKENTDAVVLHITERQAAGRPNQGRLHGQADRLDGSMEGAGGSNRTATAATTQSPETYESLRVAEQGVESFMYLSNCSTVPINYFEGRLTLNKWPADEAELAKTFPLVTNGHYGPGKKCTYHEKLAVLIPFRNRHRHLSVLLRNLIPMLIKQGVDFTIFVIEQNLPTSFNKGVVFNAGYLEALKVDSFDCFIFHDVDMLPLNDLNFYRCDNRGPVHFVAGVNKFRYQLMYHWLIGGVLGFTRHQYEKVNGFSNLYFGWGAEDDDMRLRILSTSMEVYRRPKSVGLYDMILHGRDKRWMANVKRYTIRKTSWRRTQDDGINSVRYTLTRWERKPLYNHIRIDVRMSEIYRIYSRPKTGSSVNMITNVILTLITNLKSAPDYMKKVLEVTTKGNYQNR